MAGALARVLLVATGGVLPAMAVDPKPWPPVFTSVQTQYTPFDDSVVSKPTYYDFPNRHMRVDFVKKGGSTLGAGGAELANGRSLWLDDLLYIYDFAKSSCVKLDLKMGMMAPDWFLTKGAARQTNVFLTHRSEQPAAGHSPFKNCSWMRKDGAGFGWFDYFASEVDGTVFRLTAPGAQGAAKDFVINDFVSFSPADSLPDATFDLPADIPCKGVPGGVDLAKLPEEVERLERQAAALDVSAESGAEMAAAVRALRAFGPELALAAAVASGGVDVPAAHEASTTPVALVV